MKITLCPSPDLFNIYSSTCKKENVLVVIVDILRATSVITTALANGARLIRPVLSCEQCQEIGDSNGYLKSAERNVRKCEFADLGNSPKEYTQDIVSGRGIVFTTTNGTRALNIAKDAGYSDIIIGAFLNVGAVADYIITGDYEEVLIVASGWNSMVCVEDSLFCGCLTNVLDTKGVSCILNDMATIMDILYKTEVDKDKTMLSLISKAEHYDRLVKHDLISDLQYCLQKDIYDFVVILDGDNLVKRVSY